MTTRDEQIAAIALDLKIRARICGLKQLVLESAAAFERADAMLSRELRAMIDDDRPNSSQ
jgi:hypothetical protein